MTTTTRTTAELMGATSHAGPFCSALIDVAAEREEIVGLTADLAKYTDMQAFAEVFPERFANVGMAEQNLVMAAGGAATTGLVPVTTTFAAFLTRRAFDHLSQQIVLPRLNVKLVGGLPGILASFGPSHHAIDDVAHMRTLPGLVILDPADPFELGQATKAMLDYDGPVYLRQGFGSEPAVVDPATHRFEIGRASLLRTGTDVGIVASNILVRPALDAAEALAAEGISVGVLNMSTLKPLDEQAVLDLASSTSALVTAENHSIHGGLFSAVAEVLARHGVGARTIPVAVHDVWGDFGTPGHVAQTLGLTTEAVTAAARTALQHT